MAPDLEFIGRMSHDWRYSHTLAAQLWFSMPLTVLLVWLLTRFIIPVLLPYLRNHADWQWHDLAALECPSSPEAWFCVAWSGWMGGVSHVLLDGITHGNHSGWLVPLFPLLRTPVWNVGGVMPLHDALQQWLTLSFGVASWLMLRRISKQRLLWRWRALDERPLTPMPRSAGIRLLRLLGGASLIGALTGCALRQGSGKAMAAGIAFGALDFAGITLLVAALTLRREPLNLRTTRLGILAASSD